VLLILKCSVDCKEI